MGLGLLLIAAAFGLTIYNVLDDKKAGDASAEVIEQIAEEIEVNVAEQEEQPLYKQHPDMEIPTKLVNGQYYMGLLEIPVIGLELPVIKDWSNANLKVAPCRYEGSAYSGDLIIAAHNYRSHFASLKSIQPGDIVTFTDVDGNVFTYEAAATEILDGTAVEEMKSGDWDLTLFTCTYGGRTRLTVRLIEIGGDGLNCNH